MAIRLENKQNTIAPNSEYPFGAIQDDTGANNGTPINTAVYGDFHQFFAKLLAESKITPNDLPDSALNGFQYYDSLLKLKTETELAYHGNFTDQISDSILAHTLINKIFATKTHLYYSRGTTIGTGAIYKVPLSSLPTTTPVQTIGLGVLVSPAAMFVEETTGNIYVHDLVGTAGNGGLYVFDQFGVFIPSLSLPNLTTVVINTSGICVLPDGDVVICGSAGSSGIAIYITNGVVSGTVTALEEFYSVRYSYSVYGDIYLIANGLVYKANKSGSITLVFDLGSVFRGSSEIYGNKLYFCRAIGSALYSYNLTTGLHEGNPIQNSNITFNNLYNFAINNNTLYALDSGGQILRRFTQTLNARNY